MTEDRRRAGSCIYRRLSALVFALGLFAAVVTPLSAQDLPALPHVAIEDDGAGSASELLEQLGGAPVAPIAVRYALRASSVDEAARTRLSALVTRGIPLWLSLEVPDTPADIGAWRASLKDIIERYGSKLLILELTVGRQPTSVAAYAVQVAATEARVSSSHVRVAIGGEAMHDVTRRAEVYTPALAPYVDLLAMSGDRIEGAAGWLDRIDASASIIAVEPAGSAIELPSDLTVLDGVLSDLGTRVVSRAWRSAAVTTDGLRALSPLASVVSHDLSVLEPDAVGLRLVIGSREVTGTLRHRVLFDTKTFSTLLVYWGEPGVEPLVVSMRVPVEGTPAVVDLQTGGRAPLAAYLRDAATSEAKGSAPLTGRPMLIDFNDGAGAVGEASIVRAERALTVEEIISRHHQQQLEQDRVVLNYVARARMQQYFRPQEVDAGYDIVTENRYFVSGGDVEWEELSFAVNGRRFGANRPPLPLLQPEKVLSLPLQLRFDEGYQYQLAGAERIDGFDCYVVRFEPERADPALYHGTVWIDRRTFARVRVHAVQGDLAGMVVTNEETLRFLPVASVGNRPVFLFSSLEGTQNVLIAGRIRRVDRRVSFSEFQVNDADFVERRGTARHSDRLMFRETPNGLRNYVKLDGERVVSERQSAGAKALAFGVIVDPSYSFPLPIFGINYIDFSFGSPDTQLAMLFAGVLAAGNIQRPQLFGSKRVSASLDFFAIAAPSNKRVYEPSGEVESERLLTWPLSTGLNVGWRATPFQTLSLQYQLFFDGYVRDTTTAETFVAPASTTTNGIGGGWEFSRRGYTVALNGSWFARSSWRPWGAVQPDGTLPSSSRTYTKFGASVSRDIFINALQRVHLNGAWFSGRDLDRLVKYEFGLFDATRLHGVPASVSFGEMAMARGSYSINVFDQYRLDAFIDHAWGRDVGGRGEWQRVPGIGTAINVPAPWDTILRVDFGKSWLPDRYGSLGSMSLQVMLLKPMR